jgi:hypothetical protein
MTRPGRPHQLEDTEHEQRARARDGGEDERFFTQHARLTRLSTYDH